MERFYCGAFLGYICSTGCTNAPKAPLLSQTFVFFLITPWPTVFFMKVMNKSGAFGALVHHTIYIYSWKVIYQTLNGFIVGHSLDIYIYTDAPMHQKHHSYS